MTNVWNKKYRRLFSSKYGDLGVFVLPVVWISIFLAIVVTGYLFTKLISEVINEINFFYMSDFYVSNFLEFNSLFYEGILVNLFSNASFLFILFFLFAAVFYLIYASRKLEKHSNLFINAPIFFLSFAFLFSFWWIVSISYLILGKKVNW